MNTFKIVHTDIDSSWWLKQDFISNESAEKLKDVNVLLTPNLSYMKIKEPYFPPSTSDFLLFIRRKQENALRIDLCINTEDEPKELILHSDVLLLPDILVQLVVLPLIVTLIADYIKSKLGSRESSTTIKSSITIEDNKRKRSTEINYEGSANDYIKFISTTLSLVDNSDLLDTLEEAADFEDEKRIQRLQEVKRKQSE